MEVILIVVLIIMAVKNSKLKKALKAEKKQLPAQNNVTPGLRLSPELIGKEAENLRRASENALRAKAESLLPQYEKSALVRDLLIKIREAMGADDLLWDVELNDNEVVLTTMTDAMDDRIVLVKEFYDYTTLGYEDPSRESCHRLALALALQKGLGSGYGINYQFRYDPASGNHTLSQLTVNYRKKQGKGNSLRSPLVEYGVYEEEE